MVQGRIALKHEDGGVVNIDIVETAPHNYGHNGKYEGVGVIILVLENINYGKITNLEQYTQDGRLTIPTDGTIFDYRKMYDKINQLGRTLTREEAEAYRIR